MAQEFENFVNRSYNSEPKYVKITAGVPEDYKQIKTLKNLLEINYKIVGTKEKLRRNLISKIKSKSIKYPGIDRVLSSDFISSKRKILHSGNGW